MDDSFELQAAFGKLSYCFLRVLWISSLTGCCILQRVGSAARSMQLCIFGRWLC